MRDAGRVAAAIAVLDDFDRRKVPLKTALADWARNARFAGAKDRAWISGLCLDVLRRRGALGAAMASEAPRGVTLAALRYLWGRSVAEIEALAAEPPHGAGALSTDEIERLSAAGLPSADSDMPAWTRPMFDRAFGAGAAAEAAAMSARADVDLRLNTLKAPVDKALAALEPVGAAAHSFIKTAARIVAPAAADRAPAVTVIPAFNKGWVEVQDLGSQMAALGAGDISGMQVLDYCAGGGGKTLALAAVMDNTGQIYAYDREGRRLKSLYERAERAGLRNLQIRNPAGGEGLDDLRGRMDLVFIDAPCTGSGTWRRHPDTKWRLTPQQLQRRMAEQDAALREAADYVKPGGRLIYVTCSLFIEENDDRVAAFLETHTEFSREPVAPAIEATGLLTEEGRKIVSLCTTSEGALRLTPLRAGCDAFFVARLRRRAG